MDITQRTALALLVAGGMGVAGGHAHAQTALEPPVRAGAADRIADDTDGADAEARQDTIIVQAARRALPAEALPATVDILSRDDIDAQLLLSTSPVDLLSARIPSFSPARQKLSGAGESLRGREPLYLIDGVPQSNPLRNGSRDGFTLDPAVIERVEVIFGANAIQGVGATGGVVNYVTVSGEGEEGLLRTELGVTAGLADDIPGDGTGYRGAVTALKDFGAADLAASLAVETRGVFYSADGRRIGVDGTQGEIQDSQSANVFLKGGLDIGPSGRLEATANWFELEGDGDYVQLAGDRAAGIPATSVRGAPEGQTPTNTVGTYALAYTDEAFLGGRFEAQAFHRTFESVFGGGTFGGFFNTGSEAPGELTFDQSANNSDKTGLKLTYSRSDLPVDGLTLTGGLDILRDETFQELVQTGRLWVPEVVFVSAAPFLQADQELLGGRLFLSAGLRYEDAALEVGDFTTIFSSGSTFVEGGEPEFSETLVNAGATAELLPGLTAFASYSEGFTMPDVGRVLRAVNVSGQSVDTLLSVEPIVADNLEAGLSFERGPFSAEASWFASESEFGQRLVPNAAGIFEVRREPTEIEGFEASAELDLPQGILLGVGYAALEGQSDQDGDGRIDEDLSAENISPDRLTAYAAFQPTDRLALRAQVQAFMDRSFNDGRTDTDFDGYTLVDLSAGYAIGEAGRVELGVANAFNEQYTTYFSQSALSAVTRGSRFFAGRGRTVTLRWTAEFGGRG